MTLDLISGNRTRKGKVYNSSFLNKDMTKTNPIIDYLKSLEGIDHKKIRKEYVIGEDLAKIIAGYNTEKSDAITKVFDLIKFEFDEQERFLKEELNLSEAQIFFFELGSLDYEKIISATRSGIHEGTEYYLQKNNEMSLYLARLSDFCYDKTLTNIISLKLNALELDLIRKDIFAYSEDVRKKYAGFVFDNSYKKFEKTFGRKDN